MTCKWNKAQKKVYIIIIIIMLACCVINVVSIAQTTVFWNADEYKFANTSSILTHFQQPRLKQFLLTYKEKE
jgi:flagellar basal body-associated protein FliL